MAGGNRDWDKELAAIDKQLASLPDDASGETSSKPVKAGAGKAVAAPAAPAKTKASPGEPRATTNWGVYARLGLSVALGVGMMLWPYEVRCGLNLAAYLASVVVVVASGVWSSVWTWRHRASHAHTLSLLIVLWGLVLGSLEVLPRVGYAKPDLRHPGTWTCP